nr:MULTISPECIES: glucosamine-6-phosphate deaminase [Staphylococcus]
MQVRLINLQSRTIGSQYVAIEMLKLIQQKPNAVLALATGNTMTNVYEQLSELLNKNHVDVSGVTTFNLDEYIGLDATHEQSYHMYMNHHLFQHNKGWTPQQLHLPNGVASDLLEECRAYEQQLQTAGTRDLQILGIGENTHIGFNEPGSAFDSTTRIVDLTPSTIAANSVYFDDVSHVPQQAISMGLSSIMDTQRIILVAFGKQKQAAIKALMTGEISEAVPASILQRHPNVEIIVDDDAALF